MIRFRTNSPSAVHLRNLCFSRCLRTDSECRYSKRRWHHRDPSQHRHMQSYGDGVRAGEDLVHGTPGALLGHGRLPFKRYLTPVVGPKARSVSTPSIQMCGRLPPRCSLSDRSGSIWRWLSGEPVQWEVECLPLYKADVR